MRRIKFIAETLTRINLQHTTTTLLAPESMKVKVEKELELAKLRKQVVT